MQKRGKKMKSKRPHGVNEFFRGRKMTGEISKDVREWIVLLEKKVGEDAIRMRSIREKR